MAFALVLYVAFAGFEQPAGAKPPEEPKQLVISVYKSETAARAALQTVKAAGERGELQLDAHALFVKVTNGKVKVKIREERAKGTRSGQAVAAVGGVMGARTSLGVGASEASSAEYLKSNVISMQPQAIDQLKIALEPGEAAVVSAVDARRAATAVKLQEAGAASLMTHDLPAILPQPDGVQPSRPFPAPAPNSP